MKFYSQVLQKLKYDETNNDSPEEENSGDINLCTNLKVKFSYCMNMKIKEYMNKTAFGISVIMMQALQQTLNDNLISLIPRNRIKKNVYRK